MIFRSNWYFTYLVLIVLIGIGCERIPIEVITSTSVKKVAHANISSIDGSSLNGTATFKGMNDGVHVVIEIHNATPGWHAAHIHTGKDCSDVGPHWHPMAISAGTAGVPVADATLDTPPIGIGEIGNIRVNEKCTTNVNSQRLIDSVIAVVDTQPITQSDLVNEVRIEGIINKTIPNEPTETEKQNYLNRIINRKLVLQEAKHIGITTIDRKEQVNDKLTAIGETYTSNDAFSAILNKQEIEMEVIKQWIYDSIVFDEYYKLEFINSVDTREIDDLAPQYFEANKSDFIVPEMVTINFIRITVLEANDNQTSKKLAEKIMGQLEQGDTFNTIKKKYETNPAVSIGAETIPTNTSLGAIASQLKPLEHKGPISIPEGHIIVKQIKKTPSQQRQYSEVKDEILKLIREQKAETEYEKWLNKQKSKISWYILDEALNRVSEITIRPVK